MNLSVLIPLAYTIRRPKAAAAESAAAAYAAAEAAEVSDKEYQQNSRFIMPAGNCKPGIVFLYLHVNN